MNQVARYIFPSVILALVVIYLVIALVPATTPATAMDFDDFGKLPVLDHGRVKPIDTLARVSLMIISGKQVYYVDKQEHSATQWLLDVMTSRFASNHVSAKHKSFRIDDPLSRQLLGLPERLGSLYAFEEFSSRSQDLVKAAAERFQKIKAEGEEPSEADMKLFNLAQQVIVYDENYAHFETPQRVFRIENDEVLTLLGLERREGFRYAYDEFVPRIALLIREADRIRHINDKQRSIYEAKLWECYQHVQLYIGLASLRADTLHVVPPIAPGEDWQTSEQAIAELKKGQTEASTFRDFVLILDAYNKGDVKAFNEKVAAYHNLLNANLPSDTSTARFESFFNHFAPFYQCSWMYVLTFILAVTAWIVAPVTLNRAAFWLCFLTLVVHTLAIWARMQIQGRPPVTNLYSSAVFVGWVCVGLGLILEGVFRNGIGNVVAAVLGFVTSLFAHHLAGSGDTLEMMQAVLDTNFWLATHVTCVAIGYGATLVAGVLGAVFVVRGLLTTGLSQGGLKNLSSMIYGIVCFATLFSFTGTVLGGIWADQSWGRFWGWDPKENGALIIVIWNALILHARWGGVVKQRGVAVLSVIGIMVTGWSWVGTNQLGVGLHAYGFNNTLATALVYTWGVCAGVVLLGLTPTIYWRSLNTPAPTPSRGNSRPRQT